MSCDKNGENVLIEPTGIGTFQFEESSHELHYAILQHNDYYKDAFSLTFLSKDGLKEVKFDFIAKALKSGMYSFLNYSVINEDNKVKAKISLMESDPSLLNKLEFEIKKNGEEHWLRVYNPEMPDYDILIWKGKIIQS